MCWGGSNVRVELKSTNRKFQILKKKHLILALQDLNNNRQEGYLLVIELFRDMLRHLD